MDGAIRQRKLVVNNSLLEIGCLTGTDQSLSCIKLSTKNTVSSPKLTVLDNDDDNGADDETADDADEYAASTAAL
jgi:hypothetical protein